MNSDARMSKERGISEVVSSRDKKSEVSSHYSWCLSLRYVELSLNLLRPLRAAAVSAEATPGDS